jgi:hypothetical protein
MLASQHGSTPATPPNPPHTHAPGGRAVHVLVITASSVCITAIRSISVRISRIGRGIHRWRRSVAGCCCVTGRCGVSPWLVAVSSCGRSFVPVPDCCCSRGG